MLNKYIIAYIFSILFSIPWSNSIAQSVPLIHAHNDYEQSLPFWLSYSAGASSIEVDVFLERDTLFVSHELNEISPQRTLTNLYLKPLLSILTGGLHRDIQLLIDVKSDAYSTLDRVILELERFPELTSNSQLSIVISGKRPHAKDYKNYPDFIKFDHQTTSDLPQTDLARVALVSLNYKDYSVWNGYGKMTARDLRKFDEVVAAVQNIGKPIRFWGTPDTKTAWAFFAERGITYINTDKPQRASIFLSELNRNTHRLKESFSTYSPRQSGFQEFPTNVILMIGDGNGLAQITATKIANNGELSLTNIKSIGLVNTSASDALVTDSAAGATAMATGTKTRNRSIGVDSTGQDLETLVEVLGAKSYTTGIITTDAIYGATPASFYAHTTERDDTQTILADLLKSDLDFFIAGGRSKTEQIDKSFHIPTLENVSSFDNPTAILMGDDKMPSIEEGRGDYLIRAVQKSLQILENDDAPFFLVVEAAQIDNGGHARDIQRIVSESRDFDLTIAEALQFADRSKNTLVIITADHETGGLGIADGNQKNGEVRADFLSVDHSGVMVPLFAHGPKSDTFTGVYENTEIYHKILKVLKQK